MSLSTVWGHPGIAGICQGKIGVFVTIGNILAYTDHTTLLQCWTALCFKLKNCWFTLN